MPRAALPSGIELEFESYGDAGDPTLLLVSGFNSQMLGWPIGLVEALVAQGLHAVRFDNRDVGLSSKLDGESAEPFAVLRAVLEGDPPPPVPYTLSDMAADAVGLLDHLGLERAHVAGLSMGGMIAQTIAIEHPSRVASLTSIMSSVGDQRVGRPTDEARAALLMPPPTERAAFIEAALRGEVWGSKRYFDPDAVRARAAEEYDRCFYPEGSPRHLAAMYASGDRSDALRALDVATLVIHGRDDTLIAAEGGERTAELIPGSKYVLLTDMGHDLPEPLWPVFAELIGGHVRVAGRATTG